MMTGAMSVGATSKFKNKNLLFYSVESQESVQFLTELNKNEPLKSQFILINQDDKRIILPQNIKNLNEGLVLIANGSSVPIVGKDAVHWIQHGGFSEKANGFEFFNFGKESFGTLIGESSISLTHGGTNSKSFSQCSPIGLTQNINTYEEPATKMKGNSAASQKLNQLINERNQLNMNQRNPNGGASAAMSGVRM